MAPPTRAKATKATSDKAASTKNDGDVIEMEEDKDDAASESAHDKAKMKQEVDETKNDNSNDAAVEEPPSPASNKDNAELEDKEMKEEENQEDDEADADEEVTVTNKGKKKNAKTLSSSGTTSTGKKRKAAASPITTRDRRERKTVKNYSPPESKPPEKPPEKTVPEKGRGVCLSELHHVKEALQAATFDDLFLAYRFLLWKSKGKPPKMTKKELMQSMLSFSGYLPERNPKLSKAKQAEADEEYEVKMGRKAYKLMAHQIKKLCDTFGIDRRGMSSNKEDLVNCLLDFLGEPVTMDKFEKIRSASTKKKKKEGGEEQKTEDDDDDEEEEDKSVDDEKEENDTDEAKGEDVVDETQRDNPDYWEDAMLVDGAEVSDENLRLWVRAFVRCHNIKVTTLKQTVAIATEKFGVDMTDKTAEIKDLLVEEA